LGSVLDLRCADDFVQRSFDSGFAITLQDSAECALAPSCPRSATYWSAECAGAGQIDVAKFGDVAARVDTLSRYFNWGGQGSAGLCAALTTPGQPTARDLARQQYAALLANFAGWQLGLVTTHGVPVRLLPNA